MNKLLLKVILAAIAFLIAGCASTPGDDLNDHPWNDSMDMHFRGPGSMDEDW